MVPGVVPNRVEPRDTFDDAMHGGPALRSRPSAISTDGPLAAWPDCARCRPQPIHVTVPTATNRSMPSWVDGTTVVDGTTTPIERPGPDGLIVATPLRMLFSLAAAFNQYRFERAAEDAWHLRPDHTRRCSWHYLEAHRCRGKDGVATLRDDGSERALGSEPAVAERPRTRACSKRSNADRCPPEAPISHSTLADRRDRFTSTSPGPTSGSQSNRARRGGTAATTGQRRDQDRDRACARSGLAHRCDSTRRLRQDPERAADQITNGSHARRTLELRNMPVGR